MKKEITVWLHWLFLTLWKNLASCRPINIANCKIFIHNHVIWQRWKRCIYIVWIYILFFASMTWAHEYSCGVDVGWRTSTYVLRERAQTDSKMERNRFLLRWRASTSVDICLSRSTWAMTVRKLYASCNATGQHCKFFFYDICLTDPPVYRQCVVACWGKLNCPIYRPAVTCLRWNDESARSCWLRYRFNYAYIGHLLR